MNSAPRLTGLKGMVSVLDFAVILACYLFAFQLRFYKQTPDVELNSFLHYIPWFGVLGLVTYHFFNLYAFTGRVSNTKYFYNLFIAHVVIAIELILLSYWLQVFILPRSIVILALVFQLIGIIGTRSILLYLQFKMFGKKKAVIIVSNTKNESTLVEKVLSKGEKWFDVKGIIQSDSSEAEKEAALFTDIDLFILSHQVDAKQKVEIMRYAGRESKEVLLIPEFYELFLAGAESQQIDDMLVYSVQSPLMSRVDRIGKRAVDLIVSIALLILTSPIMLLMLVLIPLTSSGKAFFVQERVGREEKPFLLLKFRSMVDNAEKNTGPVLAQEQDNRITKLGKFIRATRIDELPQLINVIKGEMSIVGPRPERGFFVNSFKQELPDYAYRFKVKPGITGLAQVMGNYSTIPSDKLRYDLMYIKNYSLLLDLKILLQTIVVVLQREQSKGVASHEIKASGKLARLLNANTQVVIPKE